jgi:hypothetical protein
MADFYVKVVECMLDQVSTMEGNLARLKKGDMRIPIHRRVHYFADYW